MGGAASSLRLGGLCFGETSHAQAVAERVRTGFIWVNSLAGLSGATLSGQLVLDVDTLLPFVAAVLVGGFVGSRYGADIAPQIVVRRLLIVVLVLAAMKRIVELLF